MAKSPIFSGVKKNAQTRFRKEGKELKNGNSLDSDGEWNEDRDEEEDEGEDKMNILKSITEGLANRPLKLNNKAAAFQHNKKNIYTGARKNAKDIVSAGTNLLESLKATLDDMRSQEKGFDKYNADCHLPMLAHQECFDRFQETYTLLLRDSGSRRSTTINAAGMTLKDSAPMRQEALKKFSKNARSQLEKAKQDEKEAVDAAELIKHIKGLLRV